MNEKKNKSATFSLGSATIAKITELAQILDLSKSGVVKVAITETLNRYLSLNKHE
jgi:hypothetical protein